MSTPLPIISLNQADKLWLEQVYKITKQNKYPNKREIWKRLKGQLPDDFYTPALDQRLVNASGEEITLLGIIALENNYSVIEKVDKLLYFAKDLLIENPEMTSVSIATLSRNCGLDEVESGILISLTNNYKHFYSQSSIVEQGIAISSFDIGNGDKYFNQFNYFKGITPIIEEHLHQLEKNKDVKDPIFLDNFNLNIKPIDQDFLPVSPIFKSRIVQTNPGICFVLMPYNEHWSNEIYKHLLQKSAEELGLQCLRADNLNGPIVMEDIWTQINQAGIIIADVTGKNPNVMYELGIVHTLGKPCILITQEINSIPFDFKHLRHYQYLHSIEGISDFTMQLKAIIIDKYNSHYPEYKLSLELG